MLLDSFKTFVFCIIEPDIIKSLNESGSGFNVTLIISQHAMT